MPWTPNYEGGMLGSIAVQFLVRSHPILSWQLSKSIANDPTLQVNNDLARHGRNDNAERNISNASARARTRASSRA